MSQHASLVNVASAALGGGDKEPSQSPLSGHDVTKDAPSFEHALHNMNSILKWG